MVTGAVEHHWARPRGCAVMNGEGRRALAYINTAQLKEPAGPFCPAPRLVISDAPITGGMPGSTSDQLSLGSFPWPMPTHLGTCADGGVSPHWQAQPGKASVTGITTCTNTDTTVTPRPQGEPRDGRGAMTSGPIGSPTHSRGEDTGRSGYNIEGDQGKPWGLHWDQPREDTLAVKRARCAQNLPPLSNAEDVCSWQRHPCHCLRDREPSWKSSLRPQLRSTWETQNLPQGALVIPTVGVKCKWVCFGRGPRG